jgi:hypothetical protein
MPKACFQKTNLVVSSAFGAGNNKIGFIYSKLLLYFFIFDIVAKHTQESRQEAVCC